MTQLLLVGGASLVDGPLAVYQFMFVDIMNELHILTCTHCARSSSEEYWQYGFANDRSEERLEKFFVVCTSVLSWYISEVRLS